MGYRFLDVHITLGLYISMNDAQCLTVRINQNTHTQIPKEIQDEKFWKYSANIIQEVLGHSHNVLLK